MKKNQFLTLDEFFGNCHLCLKAVFKFKKCKTFIEDNRCT